MEYTLASYFLTLLVAFAAPFCTSVSQESGVGGNYLSGVEEHVSSTETLNNDEELQEAGC